MLLGDSGRLGKGGETTLRTRYNAWNGDGVFDWVVEEALAGYDRIIGLDLAGVAVGASLHKAPSGAHPQPTSGRQWAETR